MIGRDLDLPRRINIGCGHDKRSGYLNVDVDPQCEPDLLLPDHDLSKLPNGHFEEVLAWDVLEHIPHAYTMSALLDWAALLHTGGRLVLQTSYVFGVIDSMRMKPSFEADFNWMRCLFGNQNHPGDFHHVGFTDRTLRVHLYAAGFSVDGFQIVDNWLIQCTAVKRRDWTPLLDLPADKALRLAYSEHLKRELPSDAMTAYMTELAGGQTIRELVKRIVGAPEALYKLGALLDTTPTMAAR